MNTALSEIRERQGANVEPRRGKKVLGAATTLPAILGLGAAVFFAAGWTAHRQSATMSGGEITGKIHFQGEKPKLLPLDMRHDPVCVSEHEGTVYGQDG